MGSEMAYQLRRRLAAASVKSLILLLVFSLGATCCDAELRSVSLIAELHGYSDTFEWNSSMKRHLLKHPESLEAVVAAFYKSDPRALNDLVRCLSDESPSRVTLGDKPVPIGIVCYEGLTKLVYFEADSPQWPGYIDASATHKELLAAQAAWQRVIKDRAFTNL
jgi:hypothetical protein